MNEKPQMMNQAKGVKHKQPMVQMISKPMHQFMNQPLPIPQMLSQPPPPSQMMPIMNKSYMMWPQPQPMNPVMEPLAFQNPFNVGKPPGYHFMLWIVRSCSVDCLQSWMFDLLWLMLVLCFMYEEVAKDPSGNEINALQQHIYSLLHPTTPFFFNTLYHSEQLRLVKKS